MIQCIAIDDEPLALEIIKKYCSETPMVKLLNTFTDAIQALAWLKVKKTDLIILDIQMPDISGIQLVQSLKAPPMVIFTTAFPQYAVKGFDLEAVDYLVKPIQYERFLKGLLKAQKIMDGNNPKPVSGDQRGVFVKSGYQSIKVYFDDIRMIEGQDDYIKIHRRREPSPVLSLMSLKSILERLPPARFMRVHRSYIIPLKDICSIRNKYIYFRDFKIPVGDTYLENVQQWLAGLK